MEESSWPDVKAIREELGMSQSELARLLGVSPRVIQSCEQGWRGQSCAIEKALLLALMAHRHGKELAKTNCWDTMHCSKAQRDECLTYRSRLGSLCWYLPGNKCAGEDHDNWLEKKKVCVKCRFFQKLLPDCVEI